VERVASGPTVQDVRDVEVLRGQGVVPASADHLLDVVCRPHVVVLSWGAVVREAVEVDVESVGAAAEIGDVVAGAAVQHVRAVEGVAHEYVVAVPAEDLVRSPLREKHVAGGSASQDVPSYSAPGDDLPRHRHPRHSASSAAQPVGARLTVKAVPGDRRNQALDVHVAVAVHVDPSGARNCDVRTG
jgi:hypothetical protein